MRIALVTFSLFVFFSVFSQQTVTLSELRSSQEKAKSDEEYNEEILDRLEEEIKNDNLKKGYYGVLKAMMAEHSFNPYKKLSYFNEGKKHLEEAIQNDPNSVELRYLRFGIQNNIPGILNYSGNLSSDKTFIIENLSQQKAMLGSLYNEIIEYLLEQDSSSESEKEKLKEL